MIKFVVYFVVFDGSLNTINEYLEFVFVIFKISTGIFEFENNKMPTVINFCFPIKHPDSIIFASQMDV